MTTPGGTEQPADHDGRASTSAGQSAPSTVPKGIPVVTFLITVIVLAAGIYGLNEVLVGRPVQRALRDDPRNAGYALNEVRRHLPDFPRYPGRIRIKHLLYMTSGLAEYCTLPRPSGKRWETDYFTTDDAIRVVLQQPRLQFAPGTRWAYSNTNYMLLAKIVERVGGMPFAEFARREIFALASLPFGMSMALTTYSSCAPPGEAKCALPTTAASTSTDWKP